MKWDVNVEEYVCAGCGVYALRPIRARGRVRRFCTNACYRTSDVGRAQMAAAMRRYRERKRGE